MGIFYDNSTEELFIISSGDITDFIYVRPSVLGGATIDGNWSCTTWVEDKEGNKLIADTDISELSDDDTEFKVYLTPAQTLSLPALGDRTTEYDWVIRLTNPTLTPVNARTLRLRLGVV